jgi:hypothetical protein
VDTAAGGLTCAAAADALIVVVVIVFAAAALVACDTECDVATPASVVDMIYPRQRE